MLYYTPISTNIYCSLVASRMGDFKIVQIKSRWVSPFSCVKQKPFGRNSENAGQYVANEFCFVADIMQSCFLVTLHWFRSLWERIGEAVL